MLRAVKIISPPDYSYGRALWDSTKSFVGGVPYSLVSTIQRNVSRHHNIPDSAISFIHLSESRGRLSTGLRHNHVSALGAIHAVSRSKESENVNVGTA